ncbi:amino-acid biosynthesis [Rhodopirellula islandica]|uniref:Amino-acid biosynthesis n=1 Tax=Rhodopirellula islandica TaxID=595434 RepID=A0A0J1BBH1_RHOIS|nr:aminotransferase class III-fold pyridoxal phosphate-dependent enzyme [Rhodopirellula islandica]KLU03987.1 amino-acid biosynthesis [Rhodopirellula islandica]
MKATGSDDCPLGEGWINAIAGRLSPTGGNSCRDALHQFADQPEWRGDVALRTKIAEQLRTLTQHDASTIADCISASTKDQALEHALATGRRHHQSLQASDTNSGDVALPPKCLCLVGSDHGRSIVARMASGKSSLRGSEWPLLPGFVHASTDRFVDRIDSSTAVALVSPWDFNGVGQPLTAEWWAQCRQRCDETGTCLIIDHGNLPAVGNGHLFAHEMVAGISADAVILSAGLTFDLPGGLLVLGQSLASHAQGLVPSNDLVGHLISSTLATLIQTDALTTDTDAFAIALAERIATRGCVRDLHVSGHTVVLELDVDTQAWLEKANAKKLHASICSEHSVLFQPPLLMTNEEHTNLIDRIDAVLAGLEQNQQPPPSSDQVIPEEDAGPEAMPSDSLAGAVATGALADSALTDPVITDETREAALPNETKADSDNANEAFEEDESEEMVEEDPVEEDEEDEDEFDEEYDEEEQVEEEEVDQEEDDEPTEQDETELESNELDEFESNEETEKH